MNDYQRSAPPAVRITPQLILGLLIIFVGVVFMLDELGIAPAVSYLRYWPVALIAIGIAKMLQARDGGGAFAGLVFTVAGVWLQAEELDIIHVSLRNVWPVGLVLVGGYLVWQGLTNRPAVRPEPATPFAPEPTSGGFEGHPPWIDSANAAPVPDAGVPSSSFRAEKTPPAPGDPNATMSVMAIMGGVTRGNNSRAFRGADVLAFMGGCELDLRKAAINGEAVIDVFAMWGGIEIRVPEDWTVVSHIVPLMAGVDDKTRPPQTATAHRLTLRGFILMAGVEVKN
jgi:predicted membrane protein